MDYITYPGRDYADMYCIIKTVEVKPNKKGVDYLDMELADKTGSINAKKWTVNPEDRDLQPGDFVKVRGTETSFNGQPQLKVDIIRKVTENDGIDISEYVPVACLPGEVMLSEIEQVVASFKDEDFKSLVNAMLNKYKSRLVYWPAAQGFHHAVRGGLLMHTLSIVRVAEAITGIYTYLNSDLLLSGIILHDIAKIEEISSSDLGVPGEYTPRGNLIGHLVIGAIEIEETGKMLGIPEEKTMLLEHMLISHHGIPEFGAAKYPMFSEALVLSLLDDLDAKLYEFMELTGELEEGKFTKKLDFLDRRKLYKHPLENPGKIELI